MALAAWMLVGLPERRWATADWCTELAGLTRPTATVLIAVVVIAQRPRSTAAIRWRALGLAAVSPLGLRATGFMATQTGIVTGQHGIELRGWGARFDGGREAAAYAGRGLTTESSPLSSWR